MYSCVLRNTCVVQHECATLRIQTVWADASIPLKNFVYTIEYIAFARTVVHSYTRFDFLANRYLFICLVHRPQTPTRRFSIAAIHTHTWGEKFQCKQCRKRSERYKFRQKWQKKKNFGDTRNRSHTFAYFVFAVISQNFIVYFIGATGRHISHNNWGNSAYPWQVCPKAQPFMCKRNYDDARYWLPKYSYMENELHAPRLCGTARPYEQ